MRERPPEPVERPSWATALLVRRLGLRGRQSQEAIALRTDGALAQRTVSHLETGVTHPLDLKYRRLAAYIKALDWTPEAFEDATGISLSDALSEKPEGALDVEPVEATETLVQKLGTIQAGGPAVDIQVRGEPVVVRCSLAVAKRYPRDKLFALEVTGDSMMCKELRNARKPIPPGVLCLFVSTDHVEPRPRDVVAVFIPSLGPRGTGVLKYMGTGRNGEGIILKSYSEDGPSYPAQAYPDMIVQGLYVGSWYEDEGRRG